MTKVIIGSDHNGFALKEFIVSYLSIHDISVNDVGCYSNKECDYSKHGLAIANLVATQPNSWRGIAICGSGIGMSITTNKLPNIRAALCGSVEDAISARELCDSNVLVLAASKLTMEQTVDILDTWLETKGSIKEIKI